VPGPPGTSFIDGLFSSIGLALAFSKFPFGQKLPGSNELAETLPTPIALAPATASAKPHILALLDIFLSVSSPILVKCDDNVA